jgi:hypothetical protein
MGRGSITNLHEGDYVQNNETGAIYRVVYYQWSFCPECRKKRHGKWCEKSNDPASMHYRYYRLRNIKTSNDYDVPGKNLDQAQLEGRAQHITLK